MADRGGISAGLADRYAGALFDLASERGALSTVRESLERLGAMLAGSADMQRLAASPVIARGAATGAMLAAAADAGLDPLTRNLLGVMGRARRLAALPRVIAAFQARLAEARGEARAQVTCAHPLSDAQAQRLRETLKARLGREVVLALTVDPAILGGLIIQLGSRRIDSSIRTKLAAAQAAMKG